MREQLPDGHLRDLRPAAVGQRTVVFESGSDRLELAGVTQPQHGHGDKGLGNGARPDWVFASGRPARSGPRPRPPGPDQLPVTGEASGNRRQPLGGLIAGKPYVKQSSCSVLNHGGYATGRRSCAERRDRAPSWRKDDLAVLASR